jgi:hypothetical protein
MQEDFPCPKTRDGHCETDHPLGQESAKHLPACVRSHNKHRKRYNLDVRRAPHTLLQLQASLELYTVMAVPNQNFALPPAGPCFGVFGAHF